MHHVVLTDNYGRPLTHLRVSVTSKCNYRCIFCHGEGENTDKDILTPYMIELVSEAARIIGIRYFKITGGEPLLRDDIPEIVKALKRGGGGEVSLTTNGYFLKDRIADLVSSGLDRVNVSLHSLNREKYKMITGVDGLQKVLEGLNLAKEYGIPVKLNFVLTRVNTDDLWNVLEYASEMGFNVNVIELIPVGRGAEIFDNLYVNIYEITRRLAEKAVRVEIRDLQSRPRIFLPTGIYVELISSYCNPFFCATCTKIRLTHNGMLKPCINRNDNLVDIRHILDGNYGREDAIQLLLEAFREANKRREPFFKLENGICVSLHGEFRGPPRFPIGLRQASLQSSRRLLPP